MDEQTGWLIARGECLIDEIDKLIKDGEAWNKAHPEDICDVDPDGELRRLRAAILRDMEMVLDG